MSAAPPLSLVAPCSSIASMNSHFPFVNAAADGTISARTASRSQPRALGATALFAAGLLVITSGALADEAVSLIQGGTERVPGRGRVERDHNRAGFN